MSAHVFKVVDVIHEGDLKRIRIAWRGVYRQVVIGKVVPGASNRITVEIMEAYYEKSMQTIKTAESPLLYLTTTQDRASYYSDALS